MALINNSDLTKELIEGAKINISDEAVPSQIAEKVVPVMEVNPKLLRTTNILSSYHATDSTSGTVYTTPANKDFYLTNVVLSLAKDVNATSVMSNVNVYVNEQIVNILAIMGTSVTAQYETTTLNLKLPLLIDRNTAINITNSTAIASISARATIFGYTVEKD